MGGDEYRLEGLAVPESLQLLHDLVVEVRRDHPEVDDEDLSMLETAVIEVAGNVVEHGRPSGSVLYALRLVVAEDRLEVVMTDTSRAPTGAFEEAALPEDPLSEVGRGLWLARAVLDDFSHVRVDGGNVWRMVRTRG